VLYLVAPVVADTDQEAEEKLQRWSSMSIERVLAMISSITEVDFARFDLDQPLPSVTTNGERGSLEKFVQAGSGKTLRQLAMDGVSPARFRGSTAGTSPRSPTVSFQRFSAEIWSARRTRSTTFATTCSSSEPASRSVMRLEQS